MPSRFDDIDRRILVELQRNARISNVELAEAVGLSPSPCLRRVKMLEEAGVIDRYVTVLRGDKLDMGMTLFVRVWLTGQDENTVQAFIQAVAGLGQVVECYLMAGDCDFLLRVVARDLAAYRHFQATHLARIPGVSNLKTDIPMHQVKQTTALPLRED